MTRTAKQLLDRFSIGYETLLEQARRWRIGEDDALKKEALELLQGLRLRFPLSLEIRQELVLALMDDGQRVLAERELEDLRVLVRNPSAELLCRLGRLFKDFGDWLNPYLPAELRQGSEGVSREANAEQADRSYFLSQNYYDEAYQVRRGHYPGINKATLMLLRASLARAMNDSVRAAELRNAAEKLAEELLERRSEWTSDQPDDKTVWHPATAAEAHLLRGEWGHAAELYRSIPRSAGNHGTIRKQILRILASLDLLEVKDRRECQSVETIFVEPPSRPAE